MAIAAWDHAVSSGVVGPCPANSRHNVSPPTTPSRTRNPVPSTPLHAASVHNATASSSSDGHSVESSSLSSHGSVFRLTSVMSVFEELGLESREPHYVVLRGISPGVYASRRVSAQIFLYLH